MDAREPSGLDSSEHSGIMFAPNSYGIGAGFPSHSMIMANSSGMRFPINTMPSSTTKPLDALGSNNPGDGVLGRRPGGIFSLSEPMKKKRGRPRKYGPDGTMALGLCSTTSTSEYDNNNTSLSEPTAKRRGRPPGSGKLRQLGALGSSGTSFTPHVIAVKAGEDVASKLMAFSQQGPRTICILSANGAICNVTLQQPTTSDGTVTYEGRFEIISLSVSFLLTENDGVLTRTGSLSVELAGSDGYVLGGVVAGILMAATPVQVVVGSFLAKKKPPKPEPSTHESLLGLPQMSGFGPLSPPSQVSSSDSDDDDRRCPINIGHCSNSNHDFQDLPPYSVGWSNAGN
ncbi:AT-hook motif nuclear-localized protein 10 [Dendrobium catenatum]|uniref:AT-hook motif nuclear-localized protein 10 n=1 Tax=Dendrobium catenatum TaxID=906689 RepID=UPI0009F3C016|nr:AT-hook motif nuclear-localized protein 10 [Dendrobium catenatum]